MPMKMKGSFPSRQKLECPVTEKYFKNCSTAVLLNTYYNHVFREYLMTWGKYIL